MDDRSAPPRASDEHELVTSHLHVIHHVLNQLTARLPRYVDRGDLWSAGAQGLVDAARRFDPEAGVAFATYASTRVRGAMIDATRSEDLASRGVRRGMRQFDTKRQQLEQQLGEAPSTEQVADAMGVTLEYVERLKERASAATVLRLDQSTSDAADGGSLGDALANDDEATSPEQRLEQQELLGMVRAALARLPENQRAVLERHFFGGELFREIATSLGVTEARVSQLRAEALNALRAYLQTQEIAGVPDVPDGAPGSRRRASYLADMQALTSWRDLMDAGAKAEAIA